MQVSAFFSPRGTATLFSALLFVFAAPHAGAVTSPYVTTQQDIPLNQAVDDDLQCLIAFPSHQPVEGMQGKAAGNALYPAPPTLHGSASLDAPAVGLLATRGAHA